MQAMLALAMGTALLGIDVGWQPIEEGGLEYIVQIDPETLARMKPGDEFATGIRPVLRDVRRYRIVIGKGPLPRIALPENPASPNPSGSSAPRPAPVPLAAADSSQRSILVPAERGSAAPPASSIGVAPLASTQPRGSVAAVPRLSPTPLAIPELKPAATAVPPADRTAARTMPFFDALPDAPAKSLPAAAAVPERDWKAPAALTAPAPAPKSSPPLATLKLNDALAAPPITIPKTESKPEPKPAPKGEPPATNLGDRYRDAERYPPAERYPADDRYRDFAPPASSQPKASSVVPPPTKTPEDRSANNATKSDSRLAEKSKTPTTELVGPVLPPQWNDTPQAKPKMLAVPPAFDIDTDDRVADVKSLPVVKTPPRIPPPALEVKEPTSLGGSRLLAENFGQKPASLVNDPSVRPVSAEPAASTVPSLPASAAKPTAPVPAAATPPEPASRPWLPLTLTLFTLFASIGGNIFLGWVAHDARSRYGSLLRESRGVTA